MVWVVGCAVKPGRSSREVRDPQKACVYIIQYIIYIALQLLQSGLLCLDVTGPIFRIYFGDLGRVQDGFP